MKLHAKIKPEYLDDIIAGGKTFEMRSLESITLKDGKREYTFEIRDAEVLGDRETYKMCMTFPNLFVREKPILLISLGEIPEEEEKK
jgi:hypothetical protein